MKRFLLNVGTVLLSMALLVLFTWIAVEFLTGENPIPPQIQK